MIYVAAAESGDGAIVDVSSVDSRLLQGVCLQIVEAIRSDGDFLPRTGYSTRYYRYLLVWIGENQPHANHRLADKQMREALASLKNRTGSLYGPSELLLATKFGDIDASTVRWILSLAALQIFDAGIREILDYFADDNPPHADLQIFAGGEKQMRALRKDIKDILEAVELAAPHGAVSPSVVSVTTPRLARGDEESVRYNDELVAVQLTFQERLPLVSGLRSRRGTARCTEAMAIAMGFASVNDLVRQYDRLTGLIDGQKPMSRTDWTRTLLATEVCFASVVVGAGLDWGNDAYNESTIQFLRILQRKLRNAGALAPLTDPSSLADAAREAARSDREQYETNHDELVGVTLTTAESSLLITLLRKWMGPAVCTDAMAIAMGFDGVEDLFGQYDRLKGLIDRGEPMSISDWTRMLLATEVCFASEVVGLGTEFQALGGDDVSALRELRGLQEKLSRMGALGRNRSPVSPAASAPTQAPPRSVRTLSPAESTPQEIQPSTGRIEPPQRGQTVEDGYSQWKLPRMRRWPDCGWAKGVDTDPSSEEKSRSANPHFASKPPRIRRTPDVDWADLLRPKRSRRRKGGG